MSRCEMPWPTRRTVLLGGSAMFAWAQLPRLASASGTRDPRFIVIVLRGALDGLATVAPVGDPEYGAAAWPDCALALWGASSDPA